MTPRLTRAEPLHQQIARHIAEQIRTGVLRNGEVLPTTRELAEQWGVSVFTINEAMKQLAAQGLVASRSRSKRVVTAPATSEPLADGLPLAYHIFNKRDGHQRQAYQFVMPGISISGVDLPVEFRDGRWHIIQADLPTPIEVDGESLPTAVLALIAARMGYAAEFHRLPDEEPG